MKSKHWIVRWAIVGIFVGIVGNALPVLAATQTNNVLANATSLNLNSELTGTFSVAGESDWYKITLNSPGRLKLSLTHLPINIRGAIYLYNRHADYMWVNSYAVNEGDDVFLTYDVVDPGTYFIQLTDQDSHTSTSTYTLGNQFTPVIDTHEPNNDIGHAFLLTQSPVQGYIFNNSDQDWFKIYVDAGSQLSLTAAPPLEMTPRLEIYDSNFGYTWASDQSVNPGDTLHVNFTVPSSGMYYIRLNDARGWSHVSPYSLTVTGGKLGFTPQLTAVTSESEPNNELKQSNLITLGSTVIGKISPAGDHDWYQLNVPHPGRLNFALTKTPATLQIQAFIYNSSGNQVLFGQASDPGMMFSMTYDIASPDIYYLMIRNAIDNVASDGDYSFTLTQNEINDIYEPDDNYGDAKLIATLNRVQAYIFPVSDEDWYRVNVNTPGNLDMVLSDLPANLIMEIAVFNMSKDWLTAKSGNPGEDVVLSYHISEPADYLIRIRDTQGNDAIEKYTLTINGAVFSSYVPNAKIDSIQPGSIIVGDTIIFSGSGTDKDGTIAGYQWRSDLQGNLSSQQTFSTSTLIQGTHTIYFKVQDNSGNWSTEVHDVVYVGTSVSNEVEPNAPIGLANEIALNRPITTKINQTGDEDFYKIYIDRPGRLNILASNVPANLRLYLELYNRHLDYLWVRQGAVNKGDNVSLDYDLVEPGFYYLRVTDQDGSFNSDYAYTLKATLIPAVDPQEPNNSMLDAFTLTTSSIQGYIFPSGDNDWFKVWVNSGSTLTVDVTNVPSDIRPSLHLYDRNRGYLWVYTTAEHDGDPVQVSNTFNESGYVYIQLYDADNHENWTQKYTLTISGNSPAPIETPVVTEQAPNEVIADANLILLDKPVTATIGSSSDNDWFKFNLTTPAVIHARVGNIPLNLRLRMRIFQEDYNQIGYREATNGGDSLMIDMPINRPDTYFVLIDCPDGQISDQPYTLTISATPAMDTFEPNNRFGDATVLKDQNRIQGLIFPSGDEDWYRVTTDAGNNLEVSITDVPQEIQPQIEIFNTSGNSVAWKVATNSGQELTLAWLVDTAGDYLIRIRDARGDRFSTQPYTLIINGAKFNTYTPLAVIDSVSPNPVLLNQQVTLVGHGKEANNGSITGYAWRSSIDGAIGASSTLSVNTLSKGTHTIFFKVKDAAQIWSPETSTLLYVGVSAPGEQENNNQIGDSNPIAFGVQYSGTIEPGGDRDYYKVHIPQPGQLTLTVTNPVGSTMKTWIESWTDDADYSWVRAGASNSGDPVTLPWNVTDVGDYYIAISDSNGNSGNKYTLTAAFTPCPDPYEPNNDFTHAALISPQGTLRGYIFPANDEDWYKINIDKPGLLSINLTNMPSNMKGNIETWDPNLSYTWVRASANNDGDNISLKYPIGITGNYFIRITDQNGKAHVDASYTMTTAFQPALDPSEPNGDFKTSTLITASPIQAYIFPANDDDFYRFYAIIGSNLKISTDTVPKELKLNLSLYNGNNGYMWVDASSPAEGQPAVLNWTVTDSGWYYVKVYASDGKYSTTSYQLSITGADLAHSTAETPATAEIEPNNNLKSATRITSSIVTGTFSAANDEDWYKFDVIQPSVVTLGLTVPSTIRSTIRLIDANGNEFASRVAENAGDFSKLVFPITQPGTYYVRLYSENQVASPDAYQLNLSMEPVLDKYEVNPNYAHAVPIQFGQAVDAMIYASGNDDWFKVHTDEPGLIRFELTQIPSNLQIGMQLYNENDEGKFTKEALNSGDPIKEVYLAPGVGNWYLKVYDRGEDQWSSKPYRLTVYFTPMVDADEPNNSFGHATIIHDSNQISGLIYPDGDQDWYQFYVQQTVLKVQLTQTDGIIPQIHLYDDSKNELISRTAENVGDGISLSYTISKSDLYYLMVQDRDGNHHSMEKYVLTFEGVDAVNFYPTAYIQSITPGIAITGQPVTFTGIGTRQNGTVLGYEWSSDKDGIIGRDAALTLSKLSAGEHIISFRVQDTQGRWSGYVSSFLHVVSTLIEESEYNNAIANANPVPLNTWVKGRIYPNGDEDYYKIYLDRQGQLTALVDASLTSMRPGIDIYNQKGDYLWIGDRAVNSGDRVILNVFMDPGWYYAKITDADGHASDLPYGVWFGFKPALDRYEPNDSASKATPITLNTVIPDAFICKENDQDWYAVKITETGRLSLSLTSVPDGMKGNIELFNANLDYMWVYMRAINNGDNVYLDYDTNVPSIYYIKITDINGKAYTTPYTLTSKFTPVNDLYEPNNDAGHAALLKTSSLDAYIFPSGDIDWYWIYVKAGSTLNVGVTQSPADMKAEIQIYNPNLDYTWAYEYANNDGDNVYLTYKVPGDGIYYVRIQDSNNRPHLTPYHLTVTGGDLGYQPPLTPVTTEVEPNSSYSTANYIALNTDVKGTINPADEEDWYKFYVNSSGIATIAHTSIPSNIISEIWVYNANLNQIDYRTTTNPGEDNILRTALIEPGYYWIKINDRGKDNASVSQYNLRVTHTPILDVNEPNDNFAFGTLVGKSTVTGYIFNKDDEDWYRLFIRTPGMLIVNVDAMPSEIRPHLELYDADKNYISGWLATNPGQTGTNLISYAVSQPGFYYVRFFDEGKDSFSGTLYTLSFSGVDVSGAPLLSPIGDHTIDEGIEYAFTIVATDPNREQTLTYSATNLPPGSAFNSNTRTFSWTPKQGQAGTYPGIHFTVSDGTYSDSQDITITVNALNLPPILSPIGNKTAGVGVELSFTLSAADPDTGETLTYSASNLPPGAVFTASTATFKWTPVKDQIKLFSNIKFEVTDGTWSDFEYIDIDVVPFLTGDLSGDIKVDLGDAILGLKVVTGIPTPNINIAATVSGGKIGMSDVIYILQKIAKVR